MGADGQFEDDVCCGCSVCDGTLERDTAVDESDLQGALERGLARFDYYAPGWHRNINLSTFDLSDVRFCAAGQGLPGGWYARQAVLNYDDLYEELDTNDDVNVDCYLGIDPWPYTRELEELWRAAIIERLDGDAVEAVSPCE